MANSSEKKRLIQAKRQKLIYASTCIGIYVFYLLLRMIWWGGSFFWYHWVGLGFLSLVNYFCLSMIFPMFDEGIDITYYQDVLFINWFVQVTTVFSSWFWLAYLSVPAYILYQYCNSRSMIPQMTAEQEEAMRSAKDQKKNRVKYKMFRR
eukprot:TRINITY_DN4497_c0_g1_i1.p1 TRINITY_DN4497_c0_g1~~TRINITY_DN4497_c0_g1_i1.p1  ORF type:complete len:150 (-),score=42.56 TRINITY_DN4497_c0_g1_i1:381-830(-)